MNFSPSDLIALGALILAFASTVCGAFIWYVQGERKKFAAERDFQHIKNNQKSMTESIVYLTDSLEGHLKIIERDILEMKISLGIKIKD
ncbi:hypothetical protein [Nostoc sp. WHI]|uniref:hypothetical protein n=1 Tax=Nostoc sp. WHI TaxID=2650611 RepID=UPI0018C4A009|nr:hypothetical protein [Nostoc sp. WHI]MBG1269870.1 hypothetical protein [Nostoc sp. WHI]